MPANSIDYFFKNNNVNPNYIFGYFDFSYSGYSGKNELTGLQSGNDSKLKIIDINNNVWKNSGYLNLDSDTYLEYFGLNSLPYAAAISFSRDVEKECILFSTLGQANDIYSGFNVGINPYGFPFVEYIDNIYGKVSILNEKIRFYKTGILFIESSQNSCSIGSFIDENNFIIEKCKFSSNGYQKSNNIYIGGAPNYINNLSGKIFEFVIQSQSFLSYDPNLILSGFLYDIEKIKTTGYISGQTGTLYGDIISVSGCQFFISDTKTENTAIDAYTGITEYFSNEQEFRDFNDDLYYSFTTSFLTGTVYSGVSKYAPTLSSLCFSETEYNKLYEFNSGYVINYSITNYSPVQKFEEFFVRYSSGIAYKFSNTGDGIFNIFTFDTKSRNNLLKFNQNNRNFINIEYPSNINGFYDIDISNQNFDLFHNGQIQRPSLVYDKELTSGVINYLPNFDFLKSGFKLFNNYVYDINFNNLIGSEGFNTEFYTLNQSYSSGGTIGSINLQNSLIFLNGQLLTSGIDYINNTILFNIDNQTNILAKIPLTGISYKNVIFTGNINQGFIYENTLNIKTNIYLKDSSMVWLNGLRMKLNEDYIELDDSLFSNQFIEINGYPIYNKLV